MALRAKYPNAGRDGYDAEWRKLARYAIVLWVEANGWLCPGWGRATHPVKPGALTADHVDPDRRTDLTLDDLGILCRSCNSRKGGRKA